MVKKYKNMFNLPNNQGNASKNFFSLSDWQNSVVLGGQSGK